MTHTMSAAPEISRLTHAAASAAPAASSCVGKPETHCCCWRNISIALIDPTNRLVSRQSGRTNGGSLRYGLVTTANCVTRNAGLLLGVHVGVMTETVPLVAPVKTVAVISVSETTVNVAGVH